MSLTLKLVSLSIRTLAKPVGNTIKTRAREQEGFRKRCVTFAQWLHRVDMRMRLGILHDAAAQERMYAREQADAAKKKKDAETSTVKTEAQQKAADAEAAADGDKSKKKQEKPKPPTIRPLSESRAIELGANFIAESFIFGVAVGLLLFERWWSRRKENKREEEVIERLRELEERNESISYLEAEVQRLRTRYEAEQSLSKSNGEKASAKEKTETKVIKQDARSRPAKGDGAAGAQA